MKPLFVLSFVAICVFGSCKKNDQKPEPETKPEPTYVDQSGVVFTFDDAFLDDWTKLDEHLDGLNYDWKGTFFVTGLDSFSQQRVDRMKALHAKGHEIGNHGLRQRNAKEYSIEHTTGRYYRDDVEPMYKGLDTLGIKATSFSYPGGEHTPTIDKYLLERGYLMLRGTSYSTTDNVDGVKGLYSYYKFNKANVVRALGIDVGLNNSNNYIKQVMQQAKDSNWVAVFYAHRPVAQTQGSNQVAYETIAEICKFVKDNDMKFYTFSELHNLEKIPK